MDGEMPFWAVWRRVDVIDSAGDGDGDGDIGGGGR